MAEPTHEQVGLSIPQLRAMLEAATEAEADSMLLRVEKGADPGPVEVWLFSEEAEGIVGMITVAEGGSVTDLD